MTGGLGELLSDPQRCARAAGLVYVESAAVGLTRRRSGKGFRYMTERGTAVDTSTREWIVALAIPPAWRDVWICTDRSGHLLAKGVDDRGRIQYLYHERWREFRDLINFYRLTEVGRALPRVRAEIDEQIKRRTLDRSLALVAMLRLVDLTGIRIGNEVYADENNSIGLCTLRKKHVRLSGRTLELRFPAKSGQRAEIVVEDRDVIRIVRRLMHEPGQRLFRVGAKAITADEVNERIAQLSGCVMTAKDFRTWRGTLVAFTSLCKTVDVQADEAMRDRQVLAAIDAAASALGNTRAVARAHYVHPHIVETYLDGSFAQRLTNRPRVRVPGLSADERRLLGYLDGLLRDYPSGLN